MDLSVCVSRWSRVGLCAERLKRKAWGGTLASDIREDVIPGGSFRNIKELLISPAAVKGVPRSLKIMLYRNELALVVKLQTNSRILPDSPRGLGRRIR